MEINGYNTGAENRLEAFSSAAAGIAHDLNNQLMLILNHLDRTDLAAVRAAADRCAALTSSLLSSCRGEMVSCFRLEPAGFLAAFARTLKLPDGVVLKLEACAGLPAINADPAALTRILNNLVSNACHAMENHGTLAIRARNGIIEVEDAGPGVPPEERERVFQPFYTTKGANGTGLGLVIVRDLMRRQGGSVHLTQRPDHGACFQLRFSLYA